MGGKANGVGLNTLGTNPTPTQYMDFIQSGALSKWSDTSKTAFNNYLLGYNYNQNQVDIAKQANEHEIEMWRLNNEYNTPAEQMKRMIAAGINPAVAYGQIDAGNASSAPATHVPDQNVPNSTNFHDTADKLSMVNTILNGVSTLFSSANQIIDGASGVQNIALRHQNNWYDKFRADNAANVIIATSPEKLLEKAGEDTIPYEIAPGIFTQAAAVNMFPELKNFGTLAQDYKIRLDQFGLNKNADKRAQDLANKQTRVDNLVQKIFKDLENGASSSVMIRDFLELFAYQMLNKN